VPFNSGAFDYQILPSGGEFDQVFLEKSNARGIARGGMGTLGIDSYITSTFMIFLKNYIKFNISYSTSISVFRIKSDEQMSTHINKYKF